MRDFFWRPLRQLLHGGFIIARRLVINGLVRIGVGTISTYTRTQFFLGGNASKAKVFIRFRIEPVKLRVKSITSCRRSGKCTGTDSKGQYQDGEKRNFFHTEKFKNKKGRLLSSTGFGLSLHPSICSRKNYLQGVRLILCIVLLSLIIEY